jgi:signal transduction histidine kinase
VSIEAAATTGGSVATGNIAPPAPMGNVARASLVLVLLLAHGLAVRLLWARGGPEPAAFIVLPIAVASLFFGIKGGVIVWALGWPYTSLLYWWSGDPIERAIILDADFLGLSARLVVAVFLGRMRDLNVALQRDLAVMEDAAYEQRKREEEQGRLIASTDQRMRDATELVMRVTQAQEEERRRIARELHDGVAQSIGSVLLELRVLEERVVDESAKQPLRTLRGNMKRILNDVGRLARQLRPSALEELGLAAALDQYAQEMQRVHGLDMQVVIHGPASESRLPPAIEITLYRIVQEAVANAARHGNATDASVVIERAHDRVRLVVEDTGAGFDLEKAQRSGGLGLRGMRERAELLGGSLSIETAPGKGTSIRVEVPLETADLEPEPSQKHALEART